MPRLLIVAAHPDDETIGASAWLDAAAHVQVIHATDGAPRDPRWRSAHVSRERYARRRRRELERALARGGLPRTAALGLDLVDQEACFAMRELARALAGLFDRRAYDLVVTHAYEGGHPDHDAVAFAVAAACRLARRPPRVLEMALYHGAGGELRAGEFVDDRAPATRRTLSAMQRARRAAMLDCFASQRETLTPFYALDHESYRPAPAYEFARPPHDGPLLYERWGFPIDGAAWRELAIRARAQLGR